MDTAIDSSVVIAFLAGEETVDVRLFKALLDGLEIYLPPAALTELLSYPKLSLSQARTIKQLPLLPMDEDYWQRAGENRRTLLSHGLKAHMPDALIAQSCIDHDVPLLTRDTDFKHYAKHCGLKLVKC